MNTIKQKKYITIITSIIVLLVIFLTIGWSTYNSTMAINSKSIARIPEEVRITGFSIYQVNNNAIGIYEEYGPDFVTADISLPNADSTITYEVKVTNLQLPEGINTGILNFYGLTEKLSILSWSGYNLKEKICDDNNSTDCGPGSQKTFYITVGYSDPSYYDSNNTNLKFDINFDFREFHKIIYENITGNYQTEVLDGDDLSVSFDNITSLELQVTGGENYIEGNNYTYNNNILNIEGVYEDLIIKRLSSYTITYDANGGYFDNNPSITTNSVTYLWRNEQNNIINGTEKVPSNGTASLYNWYTDNTNYTNVFNKNVEIKQNRTVYAMWVEKAAEMNGILYDTLQEAINNVDNNDIQANIRLLKNISENITINSGQNIVIDMQNYTLTNKANNVLISNDGKLKLINGTINSNSTNAAAINNNKGSSYLILENTNVNLTNSSGKQALYSYGKIEINGTSHLTSLSKSRATVQIQSGGSLTITGGIIEALGTKSAISSSSNNAIIIGTNDGIVNNNDIVIRGADYGIEGQVYFYDGIIKGKTDTVKDNRITKIETGHGTITGEETIDGKTYKTIKLVPTNTVTFNPNGGVITNGTKYKAENEPVGELPRASRAGYIFMGWFTSASGGTEIDENYPIEDDVTFYAHWTRAYSAEMNETYYYTIQEAITAASNNTRTTINLLRDVGEAITIADTKNIYLNLQSHTISFNGSNAVVECNGTVEITNGNITTESNSHAAINTNEYGNTTIDSVNITSTGIRQAVYNYGNATTIIKGNSYITSKTTGTPTISDMERGTVQNLENGTLIITDGTIIGLNQQAISNEGNLTIGIKQDGIINNNSLVIRGKTYGIKSKVAFNIYDGLVKGINDAILGTYEQELNTTVMNGTEIIDGNTYKTWYLKSNE